MESLIRNDDLECSCQEVSNDISPCGPPPNISSTTKSLPNTNVLSASSNESSGHKEEAGLLQQALMKARRGTFDSGYPSGSFLNNSLNKTSTKTDQATENSFSSSQSKPSCKVSGSYDECQCSCVGWAEVYIRRPTGNISWIMEVDNRDNVLSAFPDMAMHAASLDYLMLYKNNSCQPSKASGSLDASKTSTQQPSTRSSLRRHSTGSITDLGYNSESPSSGESKHNKLHVDRSKLSLMHSLLSSGPISTGELDSSCGKSKEQLKQSITASAYPIKGCKEVPGFPCSSSSEFQNKSSVSPSFIFLQLFYSAISLNENHPIPLDNNEVIDRALKILDRIPSFNAHKFGVLYVGRTQEKSELGILSNQYGSTRYADFISGLGSVVDLTECNPVDVFTGGLDCRGKDGNFAYVWKDETTQVIKVMNYFCSEALNMCWCL